MNYYQSYMYIPWIVYRTYVENPPKNMNLLITYI